MAKSFKEIIEKFNPWHDAKGRFTTGGNASFMTIRTKDPSKQKWADMAVARAKEAEAKKKPDFAGQISSIKADSDKLRDEIEKVAQEEAEYRSKLATLSGAKHTAKFNIEWYEEQGKKFDTEKMENFDVDAANKRLEEITAEVAELRSVSDMWYRDAPPRGTPEYDEWRKYRDEHDINEVYNKMSAAWNERDAIDRDVSDYKKYQKHKAAAEAYEKSKARLAEIDGELKEVEEKHASLQAQKTELGKQRETHIKNAGKMVVDEVGNASAEKVAANQAKMREIDSQMEAYRAERNALFDKMMSKEISASEYRELNSKTYDAQIELSKQRETLRQEIDDLNQTALKSTLSKVRSMGVSEEQNANMKTHLPGKSMVKQSVRDAYENYPTEWVEQSMQRSAITTRKTNRGHYSDFNDEIAISGSGDKEQYSTAIHELGHRMEYSVPGIRQAEEAFYNRRTAGEQTQRLRDVTGNKGYDTREVTRTDNFLEPYIGKDYGGRSYELVSMGFEMAYTNPAKLAQDPDYQQFIYGLLAIG